MELKVRIISSWKPTRENQGRMNRLAMLIFKKTSKNIISQQENDLSEKSISKDNETVVI